MCLSGGTRERAVLAGLAGPCPVVVDVGDLAAGADDHGVDGDVELAACFLAVAAHASPAMPVISVNVV